MDTALLNQDVCHIMGIRDGLVLNITLLCNAWKLIDLMSTGADTAMK